MSEKTKLIVSFRGHFANLEEAVQAFKDADKLVAVEISGVARRFEFQSKEGITQYLFLRKQEVPMSEEDEMGKCGD